MSYTDRALKVTTAVFGVTVLLTAVLPAPELLSACLPRWLWMLPISWFLTFLCKTLLLKFLSDPTTPSADRQAVLITGCDSGFGHALAKRLDTLGHKVYACCQFPDGPGAQKLRSSASNNIHVIGLDVTDIESIKNARQSVESTLGEHKLWAVVANAGIAVHGYLEWSPLTDVQRVFDVNVFGVIRTVQVFTPLVRESKGRVVVTTSFAGRVSTPFLVPYSMTKAAVVSLVEGLRAELDRFGVHVVSIEPNMYRTNMPPRTTTEIESIWQNLPEDTKEAYGRASIEEAAELVRNFTYMCVEDLSPVVACFEHAIRSRYPRDRYACDRVGNIIAAKLVSWLPEEFHTWSRRHLMDILTVEKRFCDFFSKQTYGKKES
ncbi:retinol dehydrogenase 7-like [Ornithodoros turicata]|uniref:retinol dehydrogenase 7-like n=1 Tax=Ornithodoros turicata TaxID=34597 RepID=UPI003138C269